MLMTTQPRWNEAATLVREGGSNGDPRDLIREGALWELLVFVDRLEMVDRQRLTIALPDRRVPPYRFDVDAIASLLGRPDRPGFASVKAR